ncbi:thymidylate synthase [Microbulbifer epialgicus]|uniref:Thymidylate synthase n=1 Tax=Microbulbifer epialgicus TaxID=393907 RepID=A0ABV4NU40_9GAMM
MKTAEQQYLALCRRILEEGVLIKNQRTNKGCLTVINADFEYDASGGGFPLVTTRKAFWRNAVAEMIGYLRGYDNANQFASIGCNTWFANANETPAWLDNPHRKGKDDIGRAYGVQLRNWRNPEGGKVDQLHKVVDALKAGYDNRRLIMTFHNPGELDRAALDACMHTHHFSVLEGTLYLTSYQRSIDVPLGLVFNMPQTVFLLRIIAQISGLKPGKVFHKLVNCHIYDNQIELMREQVERVPLEQPTLHISDRIKTLNDLETWVDPQDPEQFWVEGYEHHPAIKYPFAC